MLFDFIYCADYHGHGDSIIIRLGNRIVFFLIIIGKTSVHQERKIVPALALALLLLFSSFVIPIKPVLGAEQDAQYALYQNDKYGFSIEYPTSWYHEELTAVGGNLSPVAYFAPDSQTTNTWLSVNYQKSSTALRGLSDQQIVNTLIATMNRNCAQYTVENNGFTCSNPQFKSAIENYRGLPLYEIYNTWTKTLPDGSTLNMVSIWGMVPVQTDLYAIVVRLSTEAASVYQNEISHMLSSFDIYSVPEKTTTSTADYSNYGLQKGESISYKYSMAVDASDAETKQAVTNSMLQSLSQSMGNVTLNSIDDVEWIKYTVTNVSSTSILFNEETKIKNQEIIQNFRDIKYLQGMVIPITANIGDTFDIFSSGGTGLKGTVKGITTIKLKNTDVPVFELSGSTRNVSQDGTVSTTMSATAYFDKNTGLMLNAIFDMNVVGTKTVKMHIAINTIDWSGLGTVIQTSQAAAAIPSWVKNTSKWWSEGSVTDSDFIKAIQYLIQKGMIKIPTTQVTGQSQGVPSWVKKTAKWWSEGSVTDSDFIKGIQYLVQNGIISTTVKPQTLDSATESISTQGGTLRLTGGSNVVIPSNTLSSSQSVTLLLLSSLPQQPPSGILVGNGPSLELLFGPQQVSYQHSNSLVQQANAITESSGKIRFSMNLNNVPAPAQESFSQIADVIDSKGNHNFQGIESSYDKASNTATFSVDSSQAQNAKGIIVSSVSLSPAMMNTEPPGYGPKIWDGTTFSALPKTIDGSLVGIPSGKRTLVLIHGIFSDVNSAFNHKIEGTDQSCIDAIKEAGGYDQVVGFDYDYSDSIVKNGMAFANFLDQLNKAGNQVDVEAHSLGSIVSLYAAQKTSLHVNNMILLGGPIDGTPIANYGLTTFLANNPVASLVGTTDLAKMGQNNVLHDLQPGSALLQNIKNYAINHLGDTNFIRAVGGTPFTSLQNYIGPLVGIPNDGIVPVSSARGEGLPGPVLTYPDLYHTQLECNKEVIDNVGTVVKENIPPIHAQQGSATTTGGTTGGAAGGTSGGTTGGTSGTTTGGYGDLESYCQSKYGPTFHYDSSTNKCLSYGKYDSPEAYCQGTYGSNYHYDSSRNLCVPSSTSGTGQQGGGTTGGMSSTISARGPLTGHYTGTFTLVETYTGAACKFQSTFVADLVQSGNSFSGTVSYASASSEATLSGGTTVHCGFSGLTYSVSGSVSSSSFTLTSSDGTLTATGSFTSDLIHGTFSACGEGGCDEGTFTGSKR